jgi:hypothetical protein
LTSSPPLPRSAASRAAALGRSSPHASAATAVELVLFALLADGHVLIEDLPGLGKTLLARSFAQVCAMDFARIQFTPDLIPSDITGASIYDRSSGSFTFERGPIFTNILLADERDVDACVSRLARTTPESEWWKLLIGFRLLRRRRRSAQRVYPRQRAGAQRSASYRWTRSG